MKRLTNRQLTHHLVNILFFPVVLQVFSNYDKIKHFREIFNKYFLPIYINLNLLLL